MIICHEHRLGGRAGEHFARGLFCQRGREIPYLTRMKGHPMFCKTCNKSCLTVTLGRRAFPTSDIANATIALGNKIIGNLVTALIIIRGHRRQAGIVLRTVKQNHRYARRDTARG